MRTGPRYKSPAFALLVGATLAFLAYTGSIWGTLGFLLIFGLPYVLMKELPPYASWLDRFGHYAFLTICTLIFILLIKPILVIMPPSFNAEPYFTFTGGILAFDPEACSLRWYKDIFNFGMTDPNATGT